MQIGFCGQARLDGVKKKHKPRILIEQVGATSQLPTMRTCPKRLERSCKRALHKNLNIFAAADFFEAA